MKEKDERFRTEQERELAKALLYRVDGGSAASKVLSTMMVQNAPLFGPVWEEKATAIKERFNQEIKANLDRVKQILRSNWRPRSEGS